MDDADNNKRDYEVGYGKPPKHSQFPPGVSGYKGRRKKPREQHAEMIARVRDEIVIVNGKRISKLELAIRQAFNHTIKSGKTRDLKALMDLLDKHGAIPVWDRYAEAKAGADEAVRKIFTVFDRTYPDDDPADIEAQRQESIAEVGLVMDCPHCGPELRKRWAAPDFEELVKRYAGTGLFKQVKEVQEGRR